ncbi:hypothetical protein NRIC0766_02850 [Lactobacillus delbrueckii subsp. allosunkii]|nr:hypothetical protein NRIC0766_02850 [Lactobacillus delbrueckii subsp. sunkii]
MIDEKTNENNALPASGLKSGGLRAKDGEKQAKWQQWGRRCHAVPSGYQFCQDEKGRQHQGSLRN